MKFINMLTFKPSVIPQDTTDLMHVTNEYHKHLHGGARTDLLVYLALVAFFALYAVYGIHFELMRS